MKVDISVVSMEQEEQGRETSLEGRAVLIHCHLTTVSRAPGERKGYNIIILMLCFEAGNDN